MFDELKKIIKERVAKNLKRAEKRTGDEQDWYWIGRSVEGDKILSIIKEIEGKLKEM